MSLPSKKRIEDWFADYFQHDGIDPVQGSSEIRSALEEAEEERDADIALDVVNKLFHGHGIESISGDYHVDRYYYSIVALYVNFGDPYVPTLIYETDNDRFVLTTWGDWVERNERKYKIQ